MHAIFFYHRSRGSGDIRADIRTDREIILNSNIDTGKRDFFQKKMVKNQKFQPQIHFLSKIGCFLWPKQKRNVEFHCFSQNWFG